MTKFRDIKAQEDKLLEKVNSFPSEEKKLILLALRLAKLAHEGQKRDEGDPYVIHPIRIANTLLYDLDIINCEMISAALLHDVVEDTEISIEEIEKQFGIRIAEFVDALTRDKDKETKKEKFEKTLQKSSEIKILKACDWLDNLRSLPARTDGGERWNRHLREAVEMYIPMAKATGNEWLVKEMKKAYNKVIQLK